MKWLFAILVALNIVVFGSMVAGKLVHLNAAPASNPDSVETNANVGTSSSPMPSISIGAASNSTGNTGPRLSSAPAAPKEKTPAPAKPQADDATPAAPAAAPAANCSATAVLPEDDYHRIKGLLEHWPHTVTRFIERNTALAKSGGQTRYMVTISNDFNADTRSRLQSQGFDYALIQGKVSLGVFNRKSDASALVARAKISGYNDVQVESLGGNSSSDNPSSLSVAKMRVVFSQVDAQAAKDITAVIQRYGKLQRSACR